MNEMVVVTPVHLCNQYNGAQLTVLDYWWTNHISIGMTKFWLISTLHTLTNKNCKFWRHWLSFWTIGKCLNTMEFGTITNYMIAMTCGNMYEQNIGKGLFTDIGSLISLIVFDIESLLSIQFYWLSKHN